MTRGSKKAKRAIILRVKPEDEIGSSGLSTVNICNFKFLFVSLEGYTLFFFWNENENFFRSFLFFMWDGCGGYRSCMSNKYRLIYCYG